MEEKRTDHSRNPEKSYEIIEGMYPEAKKIEIFARFVYPDWTGIGLEAQPKKYTKFEEKCIHFDMFLSCYTSGRHSTLTIFLSFRRSARKSSTISSLSFGSGRISEGGSDS